MTHTSALNQNELNTPIHPNDNNVAGYCSVSVRVSVCVCVYMCLCVCVYLGMLTSSLVAIIIEKRKMQSPMFLYKTT